MMNSVRLTMLTTMAVSGFCAAQAHAQDAAPAGSSDNRITGEDIVVTAQRREERLIDVPISVSAMGSEALERAGAKSVSDIGTYVPNIQINQTVGNTAGPLITIRGLAPSGDTSLGRDQPVVRPRQIERHIGEATKAGIPHRGAGQAGGGGRHRRIQAFHCMSVRR